MQRAATLDPVMMQLAIDASRDVRIGPAASHELQVLANYYDLFMWFSHVSVPTNWGQYGLVESTFTDGPLASTGSHASTWPKWASVHGLAAAGLVTAVSPPPLPVTVSSLTLSASLASNYSTLTGTVTLSALAPAPNGLAVSISVDSSAVTVPAIVTVPSGSSTVTFSVTVGDLTAPATATIKAEYSYSSTTTTLALSPYIAPYALIPSNPLAAGLEALYLFTERTGTVLHDFSGKTRHAVIPAGYWLATPNLGAITLDSTYSIDVPLPNLPKYPMTLALAATRPQVSNTYLASIREAGGHGNTGLRNDGGAGLDGTVDDAAFPFSISTPFAAADAIARHTLVLVLEATQQTFYLDGVASAPTSFPTPPVGLVTGFSLGGASGTYRATAEISVAALASRAWSAADVAAFAAGPTSMVTAAVINAVFVQLFRRRH